MGVCAGVWLASPLAQRHKCDLHSGIKVDRLCFEKSLLFGLPGSWDYLPGVPHRHLHSEYLPPVAQIGGLGLLGQWRESCRHILTEKPKIIFYRRWWIGKEEIDERIADKGEE